MDSIKECHGFQDTNKEERFNTVSRSINQVIHQIMFISNVWKETLLQEIYLSSIGILINDILFVMIKELLQLKDISEAETHKLYEIFITFFQFESLFPFDVSKIQ